VVSTDSDATSWPTVSAVVPTHDRPVMLRRAVQAIGEQSYPGHIECVVVFDKSTPTPVDVVLAPNRSLVVVENSRTPGLAGARNSGVVASTGALVGFCDDDDEWLPGKVLQQVRLLRAHPFTAVTATGILVRYRGKDMARRAPSGPTTFVDLLRDRNMEIHPSSVLIRREAMLGEVGLVDEDIPGAYGEDYDWLLRAARAGDILSVPQPLVRIYWHEQSFFVGRWRTIIDALQYLLDRYPEFEREPSGLARIEGQIALAHAALGERREALTWAGRALRRSRASRHAYAAVLVASGAVSADQVVLLGRRFGRGV
jgi:glycosyltransferase involved in cell wall biosynthesis